MQNEVGKSIYYNNTEDILSKLLYQAYLNHIEGSYEKMDTLLNLACNIIEAEKDINNILKNEIKCLEIFDINPFQTNIDVLNNKIIACNTAIKENNLLDTNKKQYLDDFLLNRFKDIRQNSAFEKAGKELIRYLGGEKRSSKIVTKAMEYFYELRQDKLRDICKEFTQKRQNFLSQHIKQEHTVNKTLEKKKSLER